MRQFPIIVTVRSSSKRLPNKCLLSLGDKSVLEHVVDRLLYFKFSVVICTTTESCDDRIQDLFENQKKVQIFRGEALNKVERWKSCFTSMGIPWAHLLDADDPFFNPSEIKASLTELIKGNLDVVLPSKLSDSGYASVGTSIKIGALKKLSEFFKKQNIYEIDYIPWDFVVTAINLRHRQLQNTEFATDQKELRLTLDYEEDLDLIKNIYAEMGSYASRERIESYLFLNNHVRLKNLNRNKMFHQNQKQQGEQIIRLMKG